VHVLPCLDAELVHLDVPAHRRHQAAEQALAEPEDRAQARAIADRGDRLEPSGDATVQRVVIAALIVRLMRRANDAVVAGGVDRMAAAAIAAAVGHVGVDGEVVPTRGERLPVGQGTCGREEGLHRRRGHEREASPRDCGLERLDRRDPGFAHAPILRASAADPATQAAEGTSGCHPRGEWRLRDASRGSRASCDVVQVEATEKDTLRRRRDPRPGLVEVPAWRRILSERRYAIPILLAV
jgi:hypothetical protein